MWINGACISRGEVGFFGGEGGEKERLNSEQCPQ